MKKLIFSIFPLIAFGTIFCTKIENSPKRIADPKDQTIPKKVSYSFSEDITWSDEFNENGKPNSEIWAYDIGGGGWGNNESQVYTEELENARVDNGHLIIETIKNDTWPKYTSARLVTKNKRDFLYGSIEIKAMVPSGRGTWSAIWTLATEDIYGEAYWPDNGELDIMEHVGMDQNRIHTNIHTKAFHHSIGTNKGNNRMVSDVSTEFHLYRMDWYPNSVQFFIDDEKLFEFKKESYYNWTQWPYDKAQHLLLNIAIGGNWGGQKGIDDSIFPKQMLIDYVRYYELIETEID